MACEYCGGNHGGKTCSGCGAPVARVSSAPILTRSEAYAQSLRRQNLLANVEQDRNADMMANAISNYSGQNYYTSGRTQSLLGGLFGPSFY